MPKYRVTLITTASFVTEVDAVSEETALQAAHRDAAAARDQMPSDVCELGEWMTLEEYFGERYNVRTNGSTVERLPDSDSQWIGCGRCPNPAKMRCLVKAGDGSVMLDEPLCTEHMKAELKLAQFGMASVSWLPLPRSASSEG